MERFARGYRGAARWSSSDRAEPWRLIKMVAEAVHKVQTGGLKYPEDMPILDWSRCPAVESVPGRLGGAWVFRGTRMPVSAVFQNLEVGATVDEIAEWFSISKDEVNEVLEFAARSLAAPSAAETDQQLDAHPV